MHFFNHWPWVHISEAVRLKCCFPLEPEPFPRLTVLPVEILRSQYLVNIAPYFVVFKCPLYWPEMPIMLPPISPCWPPIDDWPVCCHQYRVQPVPEDLHLLQIVCLLFGISLPPVEASPPTLGLSAPEQMVCKLCLVRLNFAPVELPS